MAIKVDAARANAVVQAHNTAYQKGNAQNNAPTWLDTIDLTTALAETHVGRAFDTPVDNSGDAWVPHQETQFI